MRQRIHPELIYVKDDDENYNQHSSGKLCKIGTSTSVTPAAPESKRTY